EWPEIAEVLELRLRQLQGDPALQPWLLRAIGLRSAVQMIGHIGFHDAPGAEYLNAWCPGGVALGFSVFPAHRRKGYAREASAAMLGWAARAHPVTGFVLSIAPDNLPSQRLAE